MRHSMFCSTHLSNSRAVLDQEERSEGREHGEQHGALHLEADVDLAVRQQSLKLVGTLFVQVDHRRHFTYGYVGKLRRMPK